MLVIIMTVFKKCVFIFVIFGVSMPLLAMKRGEPTNPNDAIINLFWNDNAYQEAIDVEKQRQQELDEALVKAVSDADLKKVKELIGKGARIGGVRKCGAIWFALNQFEPEILEFFVENVGLDPNEYIIDSGGENADEEIVSPLLVIASSMNRPENVQYLLERGAKVHVRDAKGTTPLFAAVVNGKIDVVGILLANKANPNNVYGDLKVPFGDTPLIAAVCEQLFDIAKLLLDFGADPNLQPVDYKGRLLPGPLSRAISEDSCAMGHLLLFHNAYIRPEHIALAKNADNECLQKLVSDEKRARVVETACCMSVTGPSSVLPEELQILLIRFLMAAPLKECELH